jgi:hypothetical protein
LPDRNQFVFWSFADILGRQKVRYHPDRHRQPGNWCLLDEVAESLTANCETSSTPKTAVVPPLPVQMSTYL